MARLLLLGARLCFETFSLHKQSVSVENVHFVPVTVDEEVAKEE